MLHTNYMYIQYIVYMYSIVHLYMCVHVYVHIRQIVYLDIMHIDTKELCVNRLSISTVSHIPAMAPSVEVGELVVD